MSFNPVSVAITRAGAAVPGSPFAGRAYFVTSNAGQRSENVPRIAEAQRGEVLSLDNLTAPVQIGDLVTMPDGSYRKIITVRPYTSSLQCNLQRVPFAPMPLFLPKSALSRVTGSLLKVSDVTYVPANPPTILGYLEPASDAVKMLALGRMDLRGAMLYSLAPIALGSVVKDTFGDFWVAELPSDVYPLIGDCKTLMRHQVSPPPGVS